MSRMLLLFSGSGISVSKKTAARRSWRRCGLVCWVVVGVFAEGKTAFSAGHTLSAVCSIVKPGNHLLLTFLQFTAIDIPNPDRQVKRGSRFIIFFNEPSCARFRPLRCSRLPPGTVTGFGNAGFGLTFTGRSGE